ncbi:hypothetical protein V8C26DRAFT_396135 [Trichoderma gracile]
MCHRTSDPYEAPLHCFHHLDRLSPNEAAECLTFSLLSAVRITSTAGPIAARVRVSREKQTSKQTSVSATLRRPSYSMIRSSPQKSYGISHAATEPDKVRYGLLYDDRQASRGDQRRSGSSGRSSLICSMHDTRVATAERTRGTSGHRGACNLVPPASSAGDGRLRLKHGQPLLVAVEKMDHGLD